MKDKTYYDLTNEEEKKYRNEFIKTPVGKQIYLLTTVIQFILFVCMAMFFITLVVSDSILFDGGWFIFIALAAFLPKVYFNINFCAWLKHKFGINRW